jgi:polyisoprenoid-binding protein YceI
MTSRINFVARCCTILAAAAFGLASSATAQQRSIDTQKSAITIHVGKTGLFSGFGHEHEITAAVKSGTVDTAARTVEFHVDARTMRVVDREASESDRADVQKTMLGPDVLDSDKHPDIAFKSTSAEPSGPLSAGEGRWNLHGNLTIRDQTRPVTVKVVLKDGHYTGDATIKQTEFGITPPGVAGVRAKDELKIEFDLQLLP